MEYKWFFNKHQKGQKVRDPIQSEFFTDVVVENSALALIREGIQNSLDARRDNEKKILVRIKIGEVERSKVEKYFHGLNEHLKAENNGLKSLPDYFEKTCPYLVFSDEGTTGLTGDCEQFFVNHHTKNNFFNFFRAEGYTNKSGKEIGRWGIGKQVFLSASNINTLFGVTRCENEDYLKLMGMCVLKTHFVGEVQFNPDGWFGDLKDDFILPIIDPDYIHKFCKLFDITRGATPGLDVVIPWFQIEKIDDTKIIKSVANGYYWPILNDELDVVIEVSNATNPITEIWIDKTFFNDNENRNKYFLDNADIIRFSNNIINDLTGNADITFIISDDYEISESDGYAKNKIDQIKKTFNERKAFSVKFELDIKEKQQNKKSTFFHLYGFEGDTGKRYSPIYIRKNLIIPDVGGKRKQSIKNLVLFLIADDDVIASFLGDAENPAHTEWRKNSFNFKDKYDHGNKLLDLIIGLPYTISEFLIKNEITIDKELLNDFFSIEEEEADVRKDKNKNGKNKTSKQSIPSSHTKDLPFYLDQTDNGFVIRNNPNKSLQDKFLEIKLGYKIRTNQTSQAIKMYSQEDFDLSKGEIHVDIVGIQEYEKNLNRFLGKIINSIFKIEMTGFDINRDLVVKADIHQ